jgi:hypothetical protein
MHCGVEVTESSTNKQHIIIEMQPGRWRRSWRGREREAESETVVVVVEE